MANLLQSSQTQATQAPGYYTNYLSNLALQGANVAGVGAGAAGLPEGTTPLGAAKYEDANTLQKNAFKNVEANAGNFSDTLESAGTTLENAGTSSSPLDAATSYMTSAQTNPAVAASGYMSPYLATVIGQIGDLGQRNIMQNLAPQATAGAVGSGQFGSTRGEQVRNQTIQNANRDILAQQYGALDKGYQSALDTAIKQNQINAQLGSTAGNLASQGQQNLTNLGAQQGQLASTNQALELGKINAMATLGEQERTIAQNKQLFPLQNLSTLSGILRGYNVPTTTKTTAEMSPLSALAGVATGAAGLFSGTGTAGTGPSLYDNIVKQFGTKTSGDMTENSPLVFGNNGTLNTAGSAAADESNPFPII
jgi:hypothetical protein